MTQCSIFAAAGYLRSVWAEIENLADVAAAALQAAGVHAVRKGGDDHPDFPDQRFAFDLETEDVFKHQRSPALISLFFDLWRPTQASDWRYGDKALLIIAYSPRPDDCWNWDLIATQATGLFEHLDTRQNVMPFFDNRLWVWGVDTRPSEWAREEWFFGVELGALSDPEALTQLVINPIVALLKGGDAEAALSNSAVVTWPDQTPDPRG